MSNHQSEMDGMFHASSEDLSPEERLRKANAALELTVKRFSSIIEALGEYVWEMDREGVLLYVSDRVYEVFGFQPVEMIGRRIDDFIDETYREMTRAYLEERLASKERIHDFEHVINTKEGQKAWVKITGAPIFDEGKNVIGFRGTGIDITDRKSAEEELNKKEEMMFIQSRQAAMGEMIGMIAHQWRQPITGIGMSVNNMLLDIEMENIFPEDFERHLNTISEQVVFLSKTIDDFRNFFKVDKEHQNHAIGDIIDYSLGIIGKSLSSDNIKVTKNYIDQRKVPVIRSELMQVCLNLFKNTQDAFRDQPDKKERKIDVEVNAEGEYVCMLFRDNAGGIPDSVISHIFDAYFTTKAEKAGTGLGLYMSKIIIEEHHDGVMKVSNDAEGALFEIRIPSVGSS